MMCESAYAMWLYGSHARGTADAYSDVDVLLVADDEGSGPSAGHIAEWAGTLSVSRYSWIEIEHMAAYGSLFLQHIKAEGRCITESLACRGRLAGLLAELGPYQLALRDLTGFRTVASDVEGSMSDGDASLEFEASTLGTVFRHACILGCSLGGYACFSRKEPVERIVADWGLPRRWAEEFPGLYRYRLYVDGRMAVVKEPSAEWVGMWCGRTKRLLDDLERRING